MLLLLTTFFSILKFFGQIAFLSQTLDVSVSPGPLYGLFLEYVQSKTVTSVSPSPLKVHLYHALKSRLSFPPACSTFPGVSLISISNWTNFQPHLQPPYLFSSLQKAPNSQYLRPKTLKSSSMFIFLSHSTSNLAMKCYLLAHPLYHLFLT